MMRWQRNLWWFAAPSFVLLGAVMLYPFASAVYLSLFDYYLVRPDDAAFSLGFSRLEMGRAAALGVITLAIVSILVAATAMLVYRRERGAF